MSARDLERIRDQYPDEPIDVKAYAKPCKASRAWDYPLTPAVMIALAMAVAFVSVLAIAGALP